MSSLDFKFIRSADSELYVVILILRFSSFSFIFFVVLFHLKFLPIVSYLYGVCHCDVLRVTQTRAALEV